MKINNHDIKMMLRENAMTKEKLCEGPCCIIYHGASFAINVKGNKLVIKDVSSKRLFIFKKKYL